MSDLQLHEHLTTRLESFARDLILERADRAADLYLALLRREGALDPMRAVHTVGRELLVLVADGAGVAGAVYAADRIVATAGGFTNDMALPREVSTACMTRGDAFSGAVDVGDRRLLLSGRPILVAGEPAGVVVFGLPASEGNAALMGLASVESEIIALADEVQTERQRAVSDFLKIIRSIAKRIHLLALNASILSAQAGEHGRGFAVVAREIGDLAERTRQSTQELEQDFLGQRETVDLERRKGGRRSA